MSYILDAVRKSDMQRQRRRGETVRLPVLLDEVDGPKRPAFIAYAVSASLLVAGGIAIGLLLPWQDEAVGPTATKVAISATSMLPRQMPPSQGDAHQPPGGSKGSLALMKMEPLAAPVVSQKVSQNVPLSAEPERPLTAAPDSSREGRTIIAMEALPRSIQQELPRMEISLHAYSSKAGERLISINNRLLREGDFLVPGVRLEQITLDGMVFSCKGYWFQRKI